MEYEPISANGWMQPFQATMQEFSNFRPQVKKIFVSWTWVTFEFIGKVKWFLQGSSKMGIIRSWGFHDLPRWDQVLVSLLHDTKACFLMVFWCKPPSNLCSWGTVPQRAGRAKFIPDASSQSEKMLLSDAKPGCVPGLLFQISGFSEEPEVKRKSFL